MGLLVCVLAVGCATHSQRLRSPRAAFYANNLSAAHQQLGKLIEKPRTDESVVQLDLAMVEMMQGQFSRAEQRLRSVRDQWNQWEQTSLTEAAASYLTDDQKRAYAGEDYEKVLVHVMLTLCSLMQDGIDAESYSLQTLSKQEQLLDQAKIRWGDELVPAHYCIPAVAPYLRGVLREATFHDYDDAARAYGQTLELLPDSPFVLHDLQRAQNGVHSSPGHGVVYVIAMVGQGPYKEEVSQEATQEALLIADQILSAVSKYSVPPTLAPVKVPAIAYLPKPFDLLGVAVDGRPVSTTMPLTNLNELAINTFAAKKQEVVARAVVRRIVKKGAIYAAKDQMDVSSDIASLAMDAAGVLWEASESADTRAWGLLPGEIQILRLELPSGTHHLNLEPVQGGVPVADSAGVQVEVQDGRNTYVLSYWPNLEPIGQILTSSR